MRQFPKIVNKISKFTTYRNRLKRMRSLLDLGSEREAARLVQKHWHLFDLDFVAYCESF